MTRIHVLEAPYDLRGAMPSLGAHWDKNLKAWTYVGTRIPGVLAHFASEDYSWERWIEDDINKQVAPITPGKVEFKARPHQLEAGRKIDQFVQQGARGFVVADETGTGKSISCLLGAYASARRQGFTEKNPCRLLIVCPKSVIPHWRNTLRSLKFSNYFRVTIINYERLPKLLKAPSSAATAKRTRTKNRRVATGGTPLVNWNVIIADESHKMKNHQTAQRAKAFARVARYADTAAHAPFVIWASATIGQNPIEVGYLSPLIGQMKRVPGLTNDTWGKWLERSGYHVKEGKVGWVWKQPARDGSNKAEVQAERRADIQLLKELLFDQKFPSIRRLPEDIAGWPSIQRIAMPIDFDSSQWSMYEQVWTEFRTFLRMTRKGRDPKGALAKQLRFRQKSSLLLVPGVADFVCDLIDNGQQVALSTAFLESLDAMREILEARGIPCAEFSGRNEASREEERIRFQKGEAKVILYTVVEGVSFHANESLPDGTKATGARRSNVILDVRYSALESSQTEGRTHRDGEKSNIYYIFANNTVQEKIIRVMIERMRNLKHLSGDNQDILDEIDSIFDEEA